MKMLEKESLPILRAHFKMDATAFAIALGFEPNYQHMLERGRGRARVTYPYYARVKYLYLLRHWSEVVEQGMSHKRLDAVVHHRLQEIVKG